MKKLIIFIFSLFLLMLTSCDIDINEIIGGKTKEPTANETVIPTENPITNNPTDEPTNEKTETVAKYKISDPDFSTKKINSIEEISMDDFFNLGNRIDIKIHISQSELDKLQADHHTGLKSEIYRLASKVIITLTNDKIPYKWEFENVGIRQKGNTSRQEIYNGEGNLNLNHYKLSFDETFNDPEMYDQPFISKYGNDEYSTREFLGMSGLDFKWDKNYDHTHIREIYANYLYRACGILAQHSGLSTLSLIETDKGNKETCMGLCTVYEPATKSFIKRSLKSDVEYINMGDWDTEKAGTFGVPEAKYGDLYKCLWGADFSKNSISGNKIGIGNISGSYIPTYDRKTNKDVAYNDTLLRQAVNAISTNNYANISKYVDLEYLAISEAVGFFVGNPDSMRYNTNNFMIYLRRTDGKMVFIPIDSDRCFGIIRDWNPRDGHMHLTPLDRTNSNNNNTISLLLNTILANSNNESKTLYLEYIDMISKSSWMTTNCFNKYFIMAKGSYSDYYFSISDESTNYTFAKYISNKLKTITNDLNNNESNNNSSNNSGSTEEYSNVYFVSSINDWNSNNSKYRLTKTGNYTYSITVDVTKVENDGNNYIKFKFNNGTGYDQIDWTIDQNTNMLVLSKGSSYKYYGVNVGDVLTITINTNTLEVEIVKK